MVSIFSIVSGYGIFVWSVMVERVVVSVMMELMERLMLFVVMMKVIVVVMIRSGVDCLMIFKMFVFDRNVFVVVEKIK